MSTHKSVSSFVVNLCTSVCICGLAFCSSAVWGQERVSFSVIDRHEKPVLGLTAKDFALRVNNWPAPLEELQAGKPGTDRSEPLVALVLLDGNPNINAAMIANQAAAAAGFFDHLHSSSAIGVKLVSDQSRTLAALGHDPDAVRKAFIDFGRIRNELKVRSSDETEFLGPGGILRAIELAAGEIQNYIASQAFLRSSSVHRAVIIVSDANVNPSYYKKSLFEETARQGVYLYPIFVPRQAFGFWVEQYFDLGKNSGGVGSVFGAMNPGLDVFKMPRDNRDPYALTFNFLNIIRDLNGKYSFVAPVVPQGEKVKLELRCLKKGVSVRLPRKTLP